MRGRAVWRCTRTWLLNLPSHLDNTRRTACGRGGIVADEGARGAGGDAGKHDVSGVEVIEVRGSDSKVLYWVFVVA